MVDVESLKEENPLLLKQLEKYCRENGIDLNKGVDPMVLKAFKQTLDKEDLKALEECSKNVQVHVPHHQ
jgi:ribonuclease HIII